jgi:hypothetical protein
MSGAYSINDEMRNANKFQSEHLQGKIPLRRLRNICENNTEMDLKNLGARAHTGLIWFRTGAMGKLLTV